MSEEIAVTASIDIGKNITGLIEQLANQIGTTADKVFPWYVKQQVIEGYMFMIISSFSLLVGIILIATCYGRANFSDDNKFVPPTFIGVTLTICAFLALSLGSTDAISKIINPNFHAIHAITLDMAKLIHR